MRKYIRNSKWTKFWLEKIGVNCDPLFLPEGAGYSLSEEWSVVFQDVIKVKFYKVYFVRYESKFVETQPIAQKQYGNRKQRRNTIPEWKNNPRTWALSIRHLHEIDSHITYQIHLKSRRSWQKVGIQLYDSQNRTTKPLNQERKKKETNYILGTAKKNGYIIVNHIQKINNFKATTSDIPLRTKHRNKARGSINLSGPDAEY